MNALRKKYLDTNGVLVRLCQDCEHPFPESEFPIKQRRGDRVYRGPRCANCRREHMRPVLSDWRAENSDAAYRHNVYLNFRADHPDHYKNRDAKLDKKKVAAYNRAYRERPESCVKKAENMKRWHANHPGYREQFNAEYREKNRERLNAYDRERTKEPKRLAQLFDVRARRRARILGSRPIEKIRWSYIVERDNCTCYLCGKKLERKQVTFDHVIPLTRGGPHTEENLKVACRRCNGRKSNHLLSEITWPIAA